jgi:tRNA nucleotidyltransferase (CCA-adding enzyme)
MSASELGLGLEESSLAVRLCRAVRDCGGRAYVVGGWVRDRLLGRPTQDLDLEVHGLAREVFERALEPFGRVRRVGASFDVYLLGSPPLQVALVEDGGYLRQAAARRDLTINSMGFDPLTNELFDPHGGRSDLAAGTLRATDPKHFGDDPLRVFRVARLAATLEFRPAPELIALCAELALAEVACERIYQELCKLLLGAERPSLGLDCLRETGALRVLPELAALIDVPQNPQWHPEGCVWVHTAMVVDEAAKLRSGDREEDLVSMFAALCHDLGKPGTTQRVDGAVRARGHEVLGEELSRALMERLRAPGRMVTRVCTLVRHHLAPLQLVNQSAGGRAYRKLERALAEGDVDAEMLERVARADQLGRTTEEALAGRFAQGEAFLREARRYATPLAAGRRDVVLGRHVVARGHASGPEIGPILARCRELQDETGLSDPEQILDLVLGRRDAPGD